MPVGRGSDFLPDKFRFIRKQKFPVSAPSEWQTEKPTDLPRPQTDTPVHFQNCFLDKETMARSKRIAIDDDCCNIFSFRILYN